MEIKDITEFTIYEAVNLQNIFLYELDKEEDLSIDMNSIQKIDMVGIQLLISLVKSANIINKKIHFHNIPDNIMQEIKTSNCGSELGIIDG